ncbi:hypothetical protein C8J57DRAFT_1254763 [Mycena rebaudengoi]|nr:hypothetical protein C8J57DRAFT_1254763 [Mycena rebaudengoi]
MARSHCTTKVAVSRPPRKAQSSAKAGGASGLPDVKQEPEETATTDTVPLSVHKLSGRLPPFQPPCSYAVDHENTSVFFNIYDETEEDGERSTIYCCDVLTKKWKNLTSSIRHLPQPFGSPPRKQPLPPRFGSAMAYYKSSVHGQRILLLFGGQIDGTSHHRGEVSNELIAVDVDNCTWWVVQLAGGDAEPRVESRLVVSGDQLFLFGGKTFMDGRFEAIDSFCVATFRDMQWTWDVLDAPYPENIPSLGWCCGGTLMHDGDAEHILLTMGCDNPYNEYKACRICTTPPPAYY